MQSSTIEQPTIYASHGGGPMPLLGRQPELAKYLRNIPKLLPEKPKAIVVVSAHYCEHVLSVNSGEQPKLLFDYGGFP